MVANRHLMNNLMSLRVTSLINQELNEKTGKVWLDKASILRMRAIVILTLSGMLVSEETSRAIGYL